MSPPPACAAACAAAVAVVVVVGIVAKCHAYWKSRLVFPLVFFVVSRRVVVEVELQSLCV